MKYLHTFFLFVCVCFSSLNLSLAQQSYPNRTIVIVVPYAAGGYYDSIARAVAPRLSETLGQPVIVENKAGASGIIGTDFVAKSAPTGYTIMVGGIGPHSINPSLFSKLPYDPVKDFSPIILAATSPNILVVPSNSPHKTLADLVVTANSKPGTLNYGSAGAGTSAHLAAEMFGSAAKVKINHIPYKGSGPAVLAILAGETDMLFGTATDVFQHIKAGKLRALAVTSADRIPAFPETPSLGEAGVQNAVAAGWYGFFAPANTSTEIITILNSSINKILQIPAIKSQLSVQGTAEIIGGSPEFLARFLQSEIIKWGEVVKKSGAKAD